MSLLASISTSELLSELRTRMSSLETTYQSLCTDLDSKIALIAEEQEKIDGNFGKIEKARSFLGKNALELVRSTGKSISASLDVTSSPVSAQNQAKTGENNERNAEILGNQTVSSQNAMKLTENAMVALVTSSAVKEQVVSLENSEKTVKSAEKNGEIRGNHPLPGQIAIKSPSTLPLEFGDDSYEDSLLIKDLFDPSLMHSSNKSFFASLQATFTRQGIDFLSFLKCKQDDDELTWQRLVNYTRSLVYMKMDEERVCACVVGNENGWLNDDVYLKPFAGTEDAALWAWVGDDNEEDEDGDAKSFGDEDEDEEEIDSQAAAAQVAATEDQDYYFDSYGKIDIHEEMLRDVPRTKSYLDSFARTQGKLAGKLVMDVGCGTGILSMSLVKTGGAKKVFAMEASEGVLRLCEKILLANGMQKRVELVRGRVEKFASNPSSVSKFKVDAIVSEWMGYALLYESMMESVIVARDAFLNPGGRLYPHRARILVEAVTDVDARLGFWDDVYGFDYSAARALRTREVDVIDVRLNWCSSERVVLHDLNLETCKEVELDFTKPFEFTTLTQNDVDGICISFDCFFPAATKAEEDAAPLLSTTPSDKPTHWKQAVLWFDSPLELRQKSKVIKGTITFARRLQENRRELDITLELIEPVKMKKVFGLS